MQWHSESQIFPGNTGHEAGINNRHIHDSLLRIAALNGQYYESGEKLKNIGKICTEAQETLEP